MTLRKVFEAKFYYFFYFFIIFSLLAGGAMNTAQARQKENYKIVYTLYGYDSEWKVKIRIKDTESNAYMAIWPEDQAELCAGGITPERMASGGQETALICYFTTYAHAITYAVREAHNLAIAYASQGLVAIDGSKIVFVSPAGTRLDVQQPESCGVLEPLIDLKWAIEQALQSLGYEGGAPGGSVPPTAPMF